MSLSCTLWLLVYWSSNQTALRVHADRFGCGDRSIVDSLFEEGDEVGFDSRVKISKLVKQDPYQACNKSQAMN